MKKCAIIGNLLYLISFTLLHCAAETNHISHSVIPLLENLETTIPEKYSQNYLQQIDASLQKKDEKIRIATYNILFDIFDYQLKDPTFYWSYRFPLLSTCIKNLQADILCLQEVYPNQLKDLKQSLGSHFASFVVKSNQGELQGELNVIFYRKDRFTLDRSLYQANTLDVSSASLSLPLNSRDDAIVAKIPNFLPPDLEPGKLLTLAHFYDTITTKRFAVLNTHLSFHRINSREDQARFIKTIVEQLHHLEKLVIVSGDFNTFPNRPACNKLPFYDGDHICQRLRHTLKDTKDIALLGHIGPNTTTLPNFFSRSNSPFDIREDSDVILDHIFVSPQITVLVSATETAQINERFPSDHMPFIADILLP